MKRKSLFAEVSNFDVKTLRNFCILIKCFLHMSVLDIQTSLRVSSKTISSIRNSLSETEMMHCIIEKYEIIEKIDFRNLIETVEYIETLSNKSTGKFYWILRTQASFSKAYREVTGIDKL